MEKKKNKHKPYYEMNLEELRAATRKYDRAMPGIPGKPLSATERAEFEVSRGRGRPRVGAGSQKIAITVERTLLRQADAAAKREGISRAQLVARGLHLAMDHAPSGIHRAP